MRCIAKGPENQLPLGTHSSSSWGMPGVHGPRKLTGVSLGYGSDVWNLAPFLPPSLLPHLLAPSYVNINIYIYSLYFFFKWLTGPNFSIQRLTPCKRDWKLRVYLCNSVFSASTADRPILRGCLNGQRASERAHASLCSTLARSKEKKNYIPPGLGHSQLLSSSHSSTDLSTSLVKDIKSALSVLPFQGLLETKGPGIWCQSLS